MNITIGIGVGVNFTDNVVSGTVASGNIGDMALDDIADMTGTDLVGDMGT